MNGIQLPVDAVQWHEGMLLAPQHFQQSTLRSEQLVNYHVLTAAPFHWGVRRIRVDPLALVNGMFRITDLEAIMPDGLPVGIDADYPEPLELDLAEGQVDWRRGPVRVHLAVPTHRAEGSAAGTLARYLSIAGRPVIDDNTGESELKIPRLRPRMTLLVGESPPEKFVSFPIAEIRFQNETYGLTEFVPPMLSVAVGSALGEATSALAKRVREKAAFLSEKLRASTTLEKGTVLQEMHASVRSLSAGLPALEAMLAVGVIHPFTLYLGLTELVGHLAGLGSAQVPPVFAKYDHNDARASFTPLLAFANRMLDGVHESYSAVTFAEKDGHFSLLINEARMSPILVLGVVAPPGLSESDVSTWFESAQIGSSSRMSSIRGRRIRGAPRKRVEVAEQIGVAPGRGMVLFEVAVDPDLIVVGEDLLVLHPGDPEGRQRPAEITLFVGNAATV